MSSCVLLGRHHIRLERLVVEATGEHRHYLRSHVISTCAILEALSQTDLEEHPATTPNLCAFINEHLHQGVQDEDKSRIVSELAPYVKDWNEYAANVVIELQTKPVSGGDVDGCQSI